jgi:hypothetical protein
VAEFDFDGLRGFLASRRLQVVVASRESTAAEWRTRRLDAVDPLTSDLRRIVLRSVDSLAKRSARTYVEGWTPDPNTYSIAPADEAMGPLAESLLGAYSAQFEADAPAGPVDPAEDNEDNDDGEPFHGRALGLVARSDNPDRSLLVVRAQNPVIEMAHDRITGIIRGNRVARARRLFAYDGRIDVLVWQDWAIVANALVLENLMRDPARLAAELDEARNAFVDTNLFANVEQLSATAASDTNFARGVRRVHKSGYLDGLRLERLRAAIQDWGHATVKVTGDDRIAFDPAARWDFLRLIDDGYLTSDLTGLRYEVNSKRRWNRVQLVAIDKDAAGVPTRLHGPGAWSPRAVAEAIADIEGKRSDYFLVGPAGPELLRVRYAPSGAELWAGPPEGRHNLLLDLPQPD